jgi:ArsR family transcriptional regulator
MRYVGEQMKRAQMERISKALADQTRLRIFEAISKSGEAMNCGQLVSMRGVTPATVSHHLKILSDAGLIECKKEGQFVYSKPVRSVLEEYSRALLGLAGGSRSR